MFCVGSPLAVFLALRGVRPMPKGTIDHILSPSVCKRLFNLYHPYDPVVSLMAYVELCAKPFELYFYYILNTSIYHVFKKNK